jgi:predicted esterase
MTHGNADEVIPMAPVAEQARRLQAAGFDLAWQEFEKEHTVAGRAEVQFLARFLTSAYQGEL